MSADPEFSVTLGQEDWKAIVYCLHKNANYTPVTDFPAAHVGRERLRFIAAVIQAAQPEKPL